MPNHVHLLLWPQENKYDIAKIDCGIKGIFSKRHAAHLNKTDSSQYEEFIIENRGKKTFRFWQVGGGFDRNLWNAKAIHDSIKYIEANPIRRGLAAAPEDYRWSSAFSRARKDGVVPDTFNMPVHMANPQSQRLGVFF
jgi:putative transposase